MHDAVNRKSATWFFDGPSGKAREEIWHWWQQRRFRYNRDLLWVGLVTWVLVLVAGSAAVKEGEDFEEPIMMIFGPILYAVFANIAYTAGPIYDVTFYRGSPRKTLFKVGYKFSLILTALPGLWAVVAWLMTVVTGQKL
jgi:fumarate reductase subunit C